MSPADKNLRWLLVSPDYPPPLVGGSLVYVYNLVTAAAATVDVLTSPLPPGTQEVEHRSGTILRSRLLVRSMRPSRLQLLWMYLYLPLVTRRLWKSGQYDAVLLAAGVVGNCLLLLSLPESRCPQVVFAFAEELTIPLASRGLKNWFKRAVLARAYKRATRVVSVCGFTGDVLQSIGVSGDRVVVIPPMIADVHHSDPQPQAKPPGHRILSVGRLVKRKGFDHLLRAVDRLRRDTPDFSLIIAGDGPERPMLEGIVRERGLQGHVSFAGEVSDAELSNLFGSTDLFVLANVALANGDCEGCPTVLVEASAHGRPVVAGSSGGTADAVEHGTTGFLLDPTDEVALANRIRELLTDSGLRQRMGQAGRAKVERDHRPSVGAARLEAVVRSAVEALPA